MYMMKKTWTALILSMVFLGSMGNVAAQDATSESGTLLPSVSEGVQQAGEDNAAFADPGQEQTTAEIKEEFGQAKILDVQEEISPIEPGDYAYNEDLKKTEQQRIKQTVTLEFLDGPGEVKGKKAQTVNELEERPRDLRLKKGDIVIVTFLRNAQTGKITEFFVSDYARSGLTWVYIGLFILAICIFGGKKGLLTVLGLLVTFAVIFYVLVPGILSGGDPLWLSIVTVSIATVALHVFVGGISIKAISSILGTIGGTIVAALLASFAASLSVLSGFASDEAQRLFTLNPNLDFHGIFLAGVIVGSLGAVMDVGVTISSAIQEIKSHVPDASFKQLFGSGMNVGKDVVGTMSGTLILAYVGTGLPLILIMSSYDSSYLAANYDFIVVEIIRGIAGSIGLMTTIPITAYLAALMEMKMRARRASKINEQSSVNN